MAPTHLLTSVAISLLTIFMIEYHKSLGKAFTLLAPPGQISMLSLAPAFTSSWPHDQTHQNSYFYNTLIIIWTFIGLMDSMYTARKFTIFEKSSFLPKSWPHAKTYQNSYFTLHYMDFYWLNELNVQSTLRENLQFSKSLPYDQKLCRTYVWSIVPGWRSDPALPQSFPEYI